MITKITGILMRVKDEEVRLQVGAFEYQVLVPEVVRRQLQARTGSEITLHTIQYFEGSQMSNRMTPRLIGFLTEAEEDFFDLFCTVEKIGVKKALKALGRPVKEIASAIQRQDAKWLTTLPGIGKQTADQMIATLKTKVTKFAVMVDETADPTLTGPQTAVDGQIIEDSYAMLMATGLSPVDSRLLLDKVFAMGEPITCVQDVLSLAFKPKK